MPSKYSAPGPGGQARSTTNHQTSLDIRLRAYSHVSKVHGRSRCLRSNCAPSFMHETQTNRPNAVLSNVPAAAISRRCIGGDRLVNRCGRRRLVADATAIHGTILSTVEAVGPGCRPGSGERPEPAGARSSNSNIRPCTRVRRPSARERAGRDLAGQRVWSLCSSRRHLLGASRPQLSRLRPIDDECRRRLPISHGKASAIQQPDAAHTFPCFRAQFQDVNDTNVFCRRDAQRT